MEPRTKHVSVICAKTKPISTFLDEIFCVFPQLSWKKRLKNGNHLGLFQWGILSRLLIEFIEIGFANFFQKFETQFGESFVLRVNPFFPTPAKTSEWNLARYAHTEVEK